MIVRQAAIADRDCLTEFNRALATETEGRILAHKVVSAGVEKLLRSPTLGFYSVAEVEGQVVGSLLITTEWSDWRNGLFWWVQSVYVRPAFRRKGIYRAMYSHVKQLARDQPDICGFRLYVDRENLAAQETYCSLGMHATAYQIFEETFER